VSNLVEYGAVTVVNATAADRQLTAIRWAQRVLSSVDVVVLDVERLRCLHGTDDSSLCEVAIIDTTGVEQLNTPLRPSRPFGWQVCGTNHPPHEMSATGASFGSIVPGLLRTTASAVIATYNAPVVYELILSAVRETGIDPQHLQDPSNWRCISQARSDWLGQPHHYFPLRTAEHALDRCHATLNILREIASSQPDPADHR